MKKDYLLKTSESAVMCNKVEYVTRYCILTNLTTRGNIFNIKTILIDAGFNALCFFEWRMKSD